jgi:Lrp/AsnC family leucine-responsive transcriptional regulator
MGRWISATLRPRKAFRRKTAGIVAIDPIDSEILRLLREDGRISWRDLGAAVGLSANAAADRVRRLRNAGVIRGFTALIDPAAGGRHLEALVGVTLARDTDSDEFAILAARLEPVIEVLHLSGAPDYQLRVACRDTAELDALLRTLRNRVGAADTETTIVLRSGPP